MCQSWQSVYTGCDSVIKHYNHKHYFELHWQLYGVLCVVFTSQYFTACGNLLQYNMTLIISTMGMQSDAYMLSHICDWVDNTVMQLE